MKLSLHSLYKILPLFVFLITWAVAFKSPYQFDDYITPLQDPASQSISSWSAHLSKTLRPLTKLTYAVESSLGMNEASERRILQFILAICCAYLLALLIERITKNKIFAYLLASIWIVHPIHAESFISIAGRPTLMAMVFILLSLHANRISLKLIFAVLAILSKETAILFLFFQLFYINKKSFPVVLLSLMIIPILLRERLLKLLAYSWNEVPYIIPWWEGPAGISAGLTTLLRPFSVSLELEFPWMVSALWFFVSLMLVGLVLNLIYRWRNKSRPFSWALGLWLVLILPTQSLIPKLDPLSLRAISYSSLAYPLVFAAIWLNFKKFNRLTYAFLVSLLIIYLLAGHCLAKKYSDPVYLWQDASSKTKLKARPLVNLAYFLMREGKIREARDALIKAKSRAPFDLEIGQRLQAIETLQETEQMLQEGTHED